MSSEQDSFGAGRARGTRAAGEVADLAGPREGGRERNRPPGGRPVVHGSVFTYSVLWRSRPVSRAKLGGDRFHTARSCGGLGTSAGPASCDQHRARPGHVKQILAPCRSSSGCRALEEKGRSYIPPRGAACQDINGDGVVNVLDLIELLLRFGTSCP